MPTVKGYRLAGDFSGGVELAEKKVVSRYAIEYVVLADNASQGQITIRSTSGIPIVGLSTFAYQGESDPFAVCKRKTVTRDKKNPLIWYVRCEFDDDPNSQAESNEQDQEAAVDRPAIITWSSEYGEEVMEYDFSDPPKAVVTPVGNPFDPPLTRRVIFPVCTIERYQATYTPAIQLEYTDHVNDSAFMGADPAHALMVEIGAGQVVEDGTKLWKVTFRIRFSKNPYLKKPLNQDYQYLESGVVRDFPNGRLGNLNQDGTKAAYGTRSYGGSDGIGFQEYPSADFNALNLV